MDNTVSRVENQDSTVLFYNNCHCFLSTTNLAIDARDVLVLCMEALVALGARARSQLHQNVSLHFVTWHEHKWNQSPN